MTVDIQPVEPDGRFWINLKLDGDAMQPRGPFATPDEAEAAACRIAAMCRGMPLFTAQQSRTRPDPPKEAPNGSPDVDRPRTDI
jgi:hypothetical protein